MSLIRRLFTELLIRAGLFTLFFWGRADPYENKDCIISAPKRRHAAAASVTHSVVVDLFEKCGHGCLCKVRHDSTRTHTHARINRCYRKAVGKIVLTMIQKNAILEYTSQNGLCVSRRSVLPHIKRVLDSVTTQHTPGAEFSRE